MSLEYNDQSDSSLEPGQGKKYDSGWCDYIGARNRITGRLDLSGTRRLCEMLVAWRRLSVRHSAIFLHFCCKDRLESRFVCEPTLPVYCTGVRSR